MKTALVVDDFASMRSSIKKILEKKGFHVLESENGVDAIEKLKKEKVDLIFSDIVMPEMDGFELCERIKKDKALQKIPLIMVSTQTDARYVLKALQTGADDYIVKPVKEDILDRIVTRITRFSERKIVAN